MSNEQLDLFAAADDEPDEPARRPQAVTLRPAPEPLPAAAASPPVVPEKPQTPRYATFAGKDPKQAALDIGEAVAYAWHSHNGYGIEVPIGVVAALSLFPVGRDDAPLVAGYLLNLDDTQLWGTMRETWAYWWLRHPHLVDRASILAKWTEEDEPDRSRIQAVRAVAHAAIRAGLIDLTSERGPWVDVLSWVVTLLRSQGARQGLGEYHTPPEVAELMARMSLGDLSDLKPGMRLTDPAAGTGGLMRAAAMILDERGVDPAEFGWQMNDVDPIAAAGCAVNAMLWGLGDDVVVSCGDVLADPGAVERAYEDRRAIREHRDRMVRVGVMAAAVRGAERLIASATEKAA